MFGNVPIWCPEGLKKTNKMHRRNSDLFELRILYIFLSNIRYFYLSWGIISTFPQTLSFFICVVS
jgi:hypothetical protein